VGRLPAQGPVGSTVSDPKQPERVYAATSAGIFRSDDGGQSWQSASQGIAAPNAVAIALDQRQPQHLYAATADGALYVSGDSASSWRESARPSAGGP
jgi:photosystem II stability/assembly factor-like uncharacterized protein